MKQVVVNGKSLGIAEPGGAVRVARRIVEHMAETAPDIDFLVAAPVSSDEERERLEELNAPNVSVRVSVSRLYRNVVAKAFWEQLVLPRIAGKRLLLNLTNSAPAGPFAPKRQVVLIHDGAFLNRDWVVGAFSTYLRWCFRHLVRSKATLVTVSEASARNLKSATTSQIEPIVIPNGFDAIEPMPEAISSEEKGYVLFIGSLNPRKNLRGAAEAVSKHASGAVKLIVAGASKPIFRAEEPDSSLYENVDFLGYVSDERKRELLCGASALIFVSFDEGFGLPVLEAMSAGTPVVASRISVFEELFSGAVEFVDPHDPADIARGLSAVIDDGAYAADLRENGLACARRFSWEANGRTFAELILRELGEDQVA